MFVVHLGAGYYYRTDKETGVRNDQRNRAYANHYATAGDAYRAVAELVDRPDWSSEYLPTVVRVK